MERIIRKNGYVYLVKGFKGFETYYNMGKDLDFEIEEKPIEEEKPIVEIQTLEEKPIEEEKPKRTKKQKKED